MLKVLVCDRCRKCKVYKITPYVDPEFVKHRSKLFLCKKCLSENHTSIHDFLNNY